MSVAKDKQNPSKKPQPSLHRILNHYIQRVSIREIVENLMAWSEKGYFRGYRKDWGTTGMGKGEKSAGKNPLNYNRSISISRRDLSN